MGWPILRCATAATHPNAHQLASAYKHCSAHGLNAQASGIGVSSQVIDHIPKRLLD